MDIEEIAELYDERVRSLGINPKSVGWKSKEQQELRFEKLIQGLDLRESRVLDLGSGFGDFFSYLELQGITLSEYLGVEVSKEMLGVANKRFLGNSNVNFLQLNFLEVEPGDWDFVVASGSLNYRLDEDMYMYLERVVQKYAENCSIGLLINLLSDQVDFMQLNHIHYNSDTVRQMMEKYFNKVTVFENYGLYEFTVQGIK